VVRQIVTRTEDSTIPHGDELNWATLNQESFADTSIVQQPVCSRLLKDGRIRPGFLSVDVESWSGSPTVPMVQPTQSRL
jgi:hypothetical protein